MPRARAAESLTSGPPGSISASETASTSPSSSARNSIQFLFHENTQRVFPIVAEWRPPPVSRFLVQPQGFGLPYAGFQPGHRHSPRPGNGFEFIEDAAANSQAADSRQHKHPLDFREVTLVDDGPAADDLPLQCRGQKEHIRLLELFHRQNVIAFRWI